jgi:hypothetical protein
MNNWNLLVVLDMDMSATTATQDTTTLTRNSSGAKINAVYERPTFKDIIKETFCQILLTI